MAVAALKRKPAPSPKLYYATMLVTRAEEWCVEASSPGQAREMLESGQGHRCQLGDCLHLELETLLNDA